MLGQRLVRVLCPKCKRRYRPNPELLRKANLPADKIKYFYRPPPEAEGGDEEEDGEKGRCRYCGGTGYRGRTGVFELLVLTDSIRDLIRENPNLNAIRQEAVKNGMKYLQEDGLLQVIEGRTSIQELLRVLQVTARLSRLRSRNVNGVRISHAPRFPDGPDHGRE